MGTPRAGPSAETVPPVQDASRGFGSSTPTPAPRTRGKSVVTPYQPSQAVRQHWRPPKPPQLPFFRDPAHTVPTKWSLYRPLVRALRGPAKLRAGVPLAAIACVSVLPSAFEAAAAANATLEGTRKGKEKTVIQHASEIFTTTPTARYPYLLDLVRARARCARGHTSLDVARALITSSEKLLQTISSSPPEAHTLDTNAQWFATQVASRIALDAAAAAEHKAQQQRRPRLTGGYFRPSLFNPPLPRMKPQPIGITMMIAARVQRRQRRRDEERRLRGWMSDIRREITFWRSLGIDNPETMGRWASTPENGSFEGPYNLYKQIVSAGFEAESQRAMMKFPSDMVDRIKHARRRRHLRLINRARATWGEPPLTALPGPVPTETSPEREGRRGRRKEDRRPRTLRRLALAKRREAAREVAAHAAA